ncbi:hypothetical protein CPSG_00085 [Coccidioides posadasii str. Silveira]|uniref:Uncharacterized protein n=1 Tax=Coccidioides posadasii (strain RMSCC 757 / Silveira) TaxID=443226 RepID=E9CTU3_COCPS|nr:hypothetical protein CPSG_00085 [Coccidioides posadasii str. Silveira]
MSSLMTSANHLSTSFPLHAPASPPIPSLHHTAGSLPPGDYLRRHVRSHQDPRYSQKKLRKIRGCRHGGQQCRSLLTYSSFCRQAKPFHSAARGCPEEDGLSTKSTNENRGGMGQGKTQLGLISTVPTSASGFRVVLVAHAVSLFRRIKGELPRQLR